MLKKLQSRGNGVERGRTNQFPPSLKNLTAQQAVRGTLLYLGKSAPTPALKRNIFLDTSDNGNIILTKELEETIKALNEELQLSPTETKDETLDNVDDIEIIKN